MKKAFIIIAVIAVITVIVAQTGLLKAVGIRPLFGADGVIDTKIGDSFDYMTVGGVRYRSRVKGNRFEFYKNGEWQETFITGVNIGATKPGLFPGDLTVSYDDYYRWFGMISEMNVNSVRVYTTMRPQFYNALLDFNSKAKDPIRLFQGVWMNEKDIETLGDVYAQNDKIAVEFIKDAKNVVDVIHGNITLPARAGFASGEYTADVSKYLAGWMLGIESDPKLVISTNQNNPDRTYYEGDYMYTLSATPFEAFICRVCDAVIEYQTSKYKLQVPVGYTNWITTDPLSHPNEPHPDEDAVTVNVENLKCRDTFYPGQFACYHVYPYYPESMNYQRDYINYVDPDGKINPYRAYLRDLRLAHTMPILIGEFGIPTSRGMAHKSIMGYNQGGVDESEQGKMLLDMYNSMYEEDYAGGLLFMWQDEWFKRTWNNEKFDVRDRRPFWSNAQTNEQFFGIMAFDPGAPQTVCHTDGNPAEWDESNPVLTSAAGQLYMQSDERYVYFMVRTKGFNFDGDVLLIPLDTKDNQGNFSMSGDFSARFDKAADFVIIINGKNNSRIVTDSYYDVFYYLYGEQYRMLPLVGDIRKKNSGRFNNMRMCINYEMNIPPEGTTIDFGQFETGRLTFGNSDPKAKDYKSLADFYYKDGVLEIRIPWQLLNVMDPSGKKIMDDFYTLQNIAPTDSGVWSVGLGKAANAAEISLGGTFDWDGWTGPTYHERLKPAYYELQKGLTRFYD